MKKKIILSLLVLISLFMVTGCGKKKENPEVEKNANEILNKETDNNSDSKVLVVYFSRTGENYNVGNVEVGNTAIMASYIKEYLNADSFEIVPVNKYPDSYDECLKVATKEKEEDARPAIESKLDDISKYDTIFIGYPIWWGDVPHIILTFMDTYKLDGKTVIPFCTSGGTDIGGSINTLKKYNKNVNWINGKRLNNNEKDIKNWLNNLDY